MERTKQIEIIRKRNAELNQQLNILKQKVDFDENLNMEGYKKAKELIDNLEKIRIDWLNRIAELEKQKNEYSLLIGKVNKLKKCMLNNKYKLPWYKRVLLLLKTMKI